MKFAIAMLLSFVAAAAQAQSPELQAHMARYAVTLTVPLEGAQMSGGSGVVIGYEGRFMVATNWHVIENASRGIQVRFSCGKTADAAVIESDESADVALLAVNATIHEGAAVAPEDGADRVYYLAGFPWNLSGRLRILPLPRLPFQGWVGVPHENFRAPVTQGDSGGGVYNARGQVVGVIWGVSPADPNDSIGTTGKPFREIVARAAGYVQTQFRSPCGPSGCQPSQPRQQWHSAPPMIRSAPQPRPTSSAPAGRITQPASPPSAVSTAATQPPPRPQGCDCRSKFAAIEARLAAVEARKCGPGRQGARGETGPQGERGEKGEAGKAPEIDYAALSASIDVKALAVAIAAELPQPAPTKPDLPPAETAEPAGDQIYYGLFRKTP